MTNNYLSCYYQALTKAYLRTHKQKVHLGKIHYCTECDASYTNASNLSRHKTRVHSDMASFKSDLKEKPFGGS